MSTRYPMRPTNPPERDFGHLDMVFLVIASVLLFMLAAALGEAQRLRFVGNELLRENAELRERCR